MDGEGFLYIQEDAAYPDMPKSPACYYRPFGGSLKPHITTIEWLTNDWTPLASKGKIWIPEDQFEVQCYGPKDKKRKTSLYRVAHAHLGDRQNLTVAGVTDSRLSLDLLALDSISLNQFRRHMKKSWPYMRDVMGFEWLEGYNKVADNSMVNLLPILAGLRYVNQSKDMPSDILPKSYDNTQIDLESINFVWNEMKEKGCVTMLNDAIGHHTRGLFHYPWKSAKGFKNKPTDYYFRPWYVSNYRWPVGNASSLCFGNRPLSELHLSLMEQFMKKYKKQCHFSFNFLTALSHNDPNHIEMLDEDLQKLLERLYTKNHLNHTILVIFGDHGNRVSAIRYSYVGRFEERLPFLVIYMPEWFKRLNPHLVTNLRINRHRLTSNFDLYQTIMDIVRGRFSGPIRGQFDGRGRSLFEPISTNRSCNEADIPEQYCTCLVKRKNLVNFESDIHKKIKKSLTEHFGEKCPGLVNKSNPDQSIIIEILDSAWFTQSRMVRHGLRYQGKEDLKELDKKVPMDIHYFEITAKVLPFDLKFKARFQNENKYPERFRLNVEPLVLNGADRGCNGARSFQDFCQCYSV